MIFYQNHNKITESYREYNNSDDFLHIRDFCTECGEICFYHKKPLKTYTYYYKCNKCENGMFSCGRDCGDLAIGYKCVFCEYDINKAKDNKNKLEKEECKIKNDLYLAECRNIYKIPINYNLIDKNDVKCGDNIIYIRENKRIPGVVIGVIGMSKKGGTWKMKRNDFTWNVKRYYVEKVYK
jgi:hypothetical protein